jgi:hypothetical protein
MEVKHNPTPSTCLVCPQTAQSQCVDIMADRKIAFVENDRLETNVPSASSDKDTINRQEVLRRPSARIDPILMRYYVSFFNIVVAELQL